MKYSLVAQIAEHLVLNLRESCMRIEPAGSFRRMRAECGDLELVCIPRPGAPRAEFGQKRVFSSYLDLALYRMECDEYLGRRIKDGERYKQIVIRTEAYGLAIPNEFNLDLFIVRPESWGIQFTLRTGPAEYSHRLVTQRSLGGWLPDDMSVRDGLLWRNGAVIPTLQEADFFTAIGQPWREPQDRK